MFVNIIYRPISTTSRSQDTFLVVEGSNGVKNLLCFQWRENNFTNADLIKELDKCPSPPRKTNIILVIVPLSVGKELNDLLENKATKVKDLTSDHHISCILPENCQIPYKKRNDDNSYDTLYQLVPSNMQIVVILEEGLKYLITRTNLELLKKPLRNLDYFSPLKTKHYRDELYKTETRSQRIKILEDMEDVYNKCKQQSLLEFDDDTDYSDENDDNYIAKFNSITLQNTDNADTLFSPACMSIPIAHWLANEPATKSTDDRNYVGPKGSNIGPPPAVRRSTVKSTGKSLKS